MILSQETGRAEVELAADATAPITPARVRARSVAARLILVELYAARASEVPEARSVRSSRVIAARARVVGTRVAAFDRSRGPQVRAMCGERAARRTVIVYVRRTAYLPAQSASPGVYFVSHVPSGFRVWFVAH